MAQRANRSGFTLIELMVVVVVMAVLAGAIVPNIVSATKRLGLDRAVVQVHDLLDFAAAAAIARRQMVAVRLDAERNACWARLGEVRLPWLAEEPAAEAQVLAGLQLPEGVSVALSYERRNAAPSEWDVQQGTIRFWPDGTADGVVVELTDEGGRRETLEVHAAAGAVIFSEEE